MAALCGLLLHAPSRSSRSSSCSSASTCLSSSLFGKSSPQTGHSARLSSSGVRPSSPLAPMLTRSRPAAPVSEPLIAACRCSQGLALEWSSGLSLLGLRPGSGLESVFVSGCASNIFSSAAAGRSACPPAGSCVERVCYGPMRIARKSRCAAVDGKRTDAAKFEPCKKQVPGTHCPSLVRLALAPPKGMRLPLLKELAEADLHASVVHCSEGRRCGGVAGWPVGVR